MKTILSIALALGCASAMAQSEPPADVPQGHWAYPAVQNLYRLGILKGYPDGTFKGSRPVSRFELASAVNNLFVEIKNTTDGIQSQLDSGYKLKNDPWVSLSDLASVRRDLDSLRTEVSDLQATKTEVDGLTKDFGSMSDQLRRLRADLDAMRGTLNRVKQK